MALIKRNTFAGTAPAIAPELLNDEYSQTAINVNLTSGQLKPMVKDRFEQNINAPSGTIYKYKPRTVPNEFWLSWVKSNVFPVAGPVVTDKYDRLYWTQPDEDPQVSTYVKITAGYSTNPALRLPVSGFTLGVPAPDDKPPVVINSGTLDPDQTPDNVSYIWTAVTTLGEEGPPSPPSDSIERTDNMSIQVTMPTADIFNDPTGVARVFEYKRLYRSNTGSNSTQFQFVAEVAFSVSSVLDDKASTELGEVCPSTYWIGPPYVGDTEDGGPLQGLCAIANGVLAGFSGRRVCLSESYLPHAWPVAYRLSLESEIVAIRAISNGLVVLTEEAPYFVTGTDPSAMTAIRVDLAQACINPNSVVDMGNYIIYAGPDGLCGIEGTEGKVLTEGLITPKEWISTASGGFHAGAIKSFKHEDTYVAFIDNTQTGWIMDPRNSKTLLMNFSESISEVRGGYHDPTDGELYIINDNGATAGAKIYKWQDLDDISTNWRTLTWRTKRYVLPKPLSMSWVFVDAVYGSNGVTIKVVADGNTIANYLLSQTNAYEYRLTTASNIYTLTEPFIRLPSVLAKYWEIEVSAKSVIREFGIAQSIEELRNV